MTVKYSIKTHSQLITGTNDKYYSDPALNAVLATAEKFLITARVMNTSGGTLSLGVNLECSNDNVNWQIRSSPISLFLSSPLIGCDVGDTAVVGRFLRVSAAMGGTGTVAGYVEIWVCGRSYI
jgi:hypothetical protein